MNRRGFLAGVFLTATLRGLTSLVPVRPPRPSAEETVDLMVSPQVWEVMLKEKEIDPNGDPLPGSTLPHNWRIHTM